MASSKSPNHRGPRRRLPLSEKRRIVELTLRQGASIRAIAREHGVNRNSLYQWQGLYRAGKLGAEPASVARAIAPSATFLPVTIAPARRTSRPAIDAPSDVLSVVQVMLASGATLRIETGALDSGLICALVAELRR
jgi:transposase-like protein